MSRSKPAVREMTDADVGQVVQLLSTVLGPRPAGVDRGELFAWKHLGNPFGRSLVLVAELDGKIVGLRAFMRWRFVSREGEVPAVRAVDTATDPSLQRRGVFTELTRAALDACESEGVAFVFNTPNERSLPGYLKLGWSRVARWPVWIRARRPFRILRAAVRGRHSSGGPVSPPAGTPLVPAGEFLSRPEVESMLETAMRPSGLLSTARSPLYLRWRYGGGPVPYMAIGVGDPTSAFAIVRLRERGRLREAVICELLCAPEGRSQASELLRSIPKAAEADHAVAHFAPDWKGRPGLREAGYWRIPRAGLTFVARPIAGADPDPLNMRNWALTLGDLELF